MRNFLVRITDRNGNPRTRVVEADSEGDAKAKAEERFNLQRNGTITGVEATTQPVSAYHKR